uniref:Uncharacterized LOC101067319 n=1 Tax=Takifugu rubripes TaxID=31033 RepID=A0A674P8A3_TAKRU
MSLQCPAHQRSSLKVLSTSMASITQSSGPEIPDNHKESWLALLSAAEAYCQKSGCDLAILTACKKFPSAEGHRKRESGGVFPKECDFSYSVWGQGFLAESARRYVDDISVLHSTTMLMAQKHTRQAEEGGAKLPAEPGSEPGHVSSSTGDGGVGGVSPSSRMFSQSYPSIYSSGAVSRRGGGHAGEKERERGSQEAQRGRQRSGIVDVDEACEDEEEDEEEEEDEQRAYGNESAGTGRVVAGSCCPVHTSQPFLLQVFSPWTRTRCPATASLSGRMARRRARTVSGVRSNVHVRSFALFSLFCWPRLTERGRPAATTGHRHGSAGVPVPSGQRHGVGPLAARVCASVGLQRDPVSSGRQWQRRAGERNRVEPPRHLAC